MKQNEYEEPRMCFHRFNGVCMFNGCPCDDGFNGIKCEYFLEKECGDKEIANGNVFSMKDMKFVKKSEKKPYSDFPEDFTDDFDDE